ncbi:MAG: hypothetical protein ABF629_06355 [Sporolactobacillus sp.]
MVLQEIYEQTVELDELIKDYEREDRDAFIEKLQQLLGSRETLLKELPDHCSDSDRQIGQKIDEMNQRINQSLQSIKQEITNDMSQFRHRKKTVNRYRNPYSGPTKDGMFLDKRE